MIFDLFGTQRKKLREELEHVKKSLEEAMEHQVVLGMPELDEMADILFPSLEIHKRDDKEFYVDYAVDSNLNVVLKDIQTQQVDLVTLGSLKEALGRIEKVKGMLSLNRGNLNREIKYYVVGNNFNPAWAEDIQVKADPL